MFKKVTEKVEADLPPVKTCQVWLRPTTIQYEKQTPQSGREENEEGKEKLE